jgi:hypothetical protein
MPHAMTVREAIAALECPNYSDSVWAGPFEQLVGAAYALLAAERHGFSRHDERKYQFHAHVRENVAAWVAEEPFRPSDQSAFDDWVSGFYFNSALQRLVGAGEQLVTVFAAQECPCGKLPAGRHGQHDGFRPSCQAAQRLLEHLRSAHRKELPELEAVLKQMSSPAKRGVAFDPAHALVVVRGELHQRQAHGARQPETRSAGRRPKVSRPTVGPELQMTMACAAFAQLARAYNQLAEWHPAARESTCLALGATA